MNIAALRMISRVLIVLMTLLTFQTAQAGMISTDQTISTTSSQNDRAMVLSQIRRSDVASQLQSMGVDPKAAMDRVAAMTDQEVHTLADKIGSQPAGAGTTSAWAWAAGLLIAGLIYYYYWK